MNKSQEEWMERVAERAEAYISPENPNPDYDRASRELQCEDYITDIYKNVYRSGAWAYPYDLMREIQKKYNNTTYTIDDVKHACDWLCFQGFLFMKVYEHGEKYTVKR